MKFATRGSCEGYVMAPPEHGQQRAKTGILRVGSDYARALSVNKNCQPAEVNHESSIDCGRLWGLTGFFQ